MTSHLVFRSWFLNLLNTCQAGKELDEFGVSISLCHKLKSCSKLMKILSERYRRQYKGRGKGITTKVQGYLFRGHKTCLLFVLVITWLYIHTEFKRIYWKDKFYCKISQFKKKRIATIYNPQNIRIHAYKVNKYEWVREVQKVNWWEDRIRKSPFNYHYGNNCFQQESSTDSKTLVSKSLRVNKIVTQYLPTRYLLIMKGEIGKFSEEKSDRQSLNQVIKVSTARQDNKHVLPRKMHKGWRNTYAATWWNSC